MPVGYPPPIPPPPPNSRAPSSSPAHGVKLLTHAPFSAGSGRGLQPFTRRPLMRFQNLRARWRESDLRWRNWAVERRQRCCSNHFWHKTTEQCAVVRLCGYTEGSEAHSKAQFDLKNYPRRFLVRPICVLYAMRIWGIVIKVMYSFNYLVQTFVGLLLALVYEHGNKVFGCFVINTRQLCSIFQLFIFYVLATGIWRVPSVIYPVNEMKTNVLSVSLMIMSFFFLFCFFKSNPLQYSPCR